MGYHTEMDGFGRGVKIVLLIVNFFIFLGGIFLMGLGIWALVDKVHYISELTGNNMIAGTVFVLLVSGILVTIVSIMGCIGASREIKIILFMYMLAILLLFVVIFIGGVLGFVFRGQFVDTLKSQMTNSMQLYNQRSEITEAWDHVQSKRGCCGVNSWHDWLRYLPNIPKSCCRLMNGQISQSCSMFQESITQANVYTNGCTRDIREHMEKHAAILGGAGFVVAFIMLVGMVLAGVLFKMIR